jgi:hypothetical protein
MGTAKPTDKMINAGDVIIDDIRLVSFTGFEVDLKKILTAFNLYEDIYSNGLSGYVIILDSLNLAKNVPIIGQEEIHLSFKTPGVDNELRKVRLKVFKVSSQIHGDEGQVITLLKLELASPLVTLSNGIKLNRVYNGMSYSSMVESIYRDMVQVDASLPPLYVEDTEGKASVMVSNWSPLYTINWISYRSTSRADHMASDYLFYQTLDAYHFKSLSMLKKLPPVCTYKNIPAGSRDPKTDERLIERDLRSIMEHTIVDVNDTLKRTSTGMYSSSQIVHEVTTKSYYNTEYSYRDAFNRMSHLNKHRVITYDNNIQDMPKSYIKYHNKSHYSFTGTDDANFVDRSLIRQAQMNLMNVFTMSIRVFGDTTIRVGNVIDIEFTSPEDRAKTNEETDRYLSGKYMIVSICHDYKQGIHEMLMTVARDSYSEPIPDSKQKEISFA